jgi:hypothetical protein
MQVPPTPSLHVNINLVVEALNCVGFIRTGRGEQRAGPSTVH